MSSHKNPDKQATAPVTCNKCRWYLTEDSGYSNYTLTCTNAHCLLSAHPNMPADIEAYNPFPEELLNYAVTCLRFQEGEITEIDCDREQVPRADDTYAIKDGRIKLYREALYYAKDPVTLAYLKLLVGIPLEDNADEQN